MKKRKAQDRYEWIHTTWMDAPSEWKSAGNIAGLWGGDEWACAMEQTWAEWQGLA